MTADLTATDAALHIDDLFDPAQLVACIEAGLVRARQHPTLPLTIYNYAEMAVYTRHWNDVTSQCRGLIVDNEGAVIARPWPKFFNYGEHPEGSLSLTDRVEVTDKADGSLGILVDAPQYGDPFLATRGSFASEQALHGTEVYRKLYDERWTPDPTRTYLFEIVYPNNRIVLDYDGLDDLILLGSIDKVTGKTFGPLADPSWPGPRAQTFAYAVLADALAAEPRPNAEGVVVRFVDIDLLVKIKQQDYVELHRIVTGLNARVVWEKCAEADGLPALLEALPDEFQRWAIDLAASLNEQAAEIERQANEEHGFILRDLDGQEWGRKEYALKAIQSPHRALLFLLLDGRPLREHIWKTLKPSGDLVPRYFGEDTA